MIDITREESAKIARVFPRSAATRFVHQKLDSVHIRKHFLENRFAGHRRKVVIAKLFRLSVSIQPHQLRNLMAMNLWSNKSEFFLECLLQHTEIAVFTKNEWQNNPMVSRADPAVRAHIALKGFLGPLADIRWRPAIARVL